MEKKTPTPMTPFDEWTVPKELHMLKLLLPYTPAASRQALGILIKVIELQHTIRYFDRQKSFLHEQDFSAGFSSPMEMLEEISPYLPGEHANMMETFRNMMNIMDMVQMMQAFSDDTGNTGPDPGNEASFQKSADSGKGDSFADSGGSERGMPFMDFGGSGNGFDPLQLVMGMLSPEQRDMFEMYQTMFSQTGEPAAPEFSSDDTSEADHPDHTFVEEEENMDMVQAEADIQNMESQDIKIERMDIDHE